MTTRRPLVRIGGRNVEMPDGELLRRNRIASSIGDVLPDPGGPEAAGTEAWSVPQGVPMVWNGSSWQAAAGQGQGGNALPYTQASPATQWQVVHGFGRTVGVTVYAEDGVQIFPTVTRLSSDEILITHATPQAGTALIS